TGGEQKVTVQHVSVNEGGQAIVGNVNQTPSGIAAEKPVTTTPGLPDARQQAMPIIETTPAQVVPLRTKKKDGGTYPAQCPPEARTPALGGEVSLGQALQGGTGSPEKRLPTARWRRGNRRP